MIKKGKLLIIILILLTVLLCDTELSEELFTINNKFVKLGSFKSSSPLIKHVNSGYAKKLGKSKEQYMIHHLTAIIHRIRLC